MHDRGAFMDFVAIDFETANRSRISACAVGLTRVKDGQIAEQASWLIKPPKGMQFLADFTAIHGIAAGDVEFAATFKELWPEMEKFIGGDMLAAHNASFDMGILKALLTKYKVEIPAVKYVCSLEIVRFNWNFQSNRLNDVAAKLGIELNHHDPASDANACAAIVIAACKERRCKSIEDLMEKLHLSIYSLADEIPPRAKNKSGNGIVAEQRQERLKFD